MTSGAPPSGTPLTTKLGIREAHDVVLLSAPQWLEASLRPLPAGVRLGRRARTGADVVLTFETRERDLRSRFGSLAERLNPAGGLWVAWPKKMSTIRTDLSFETVQRVGLDAGLVDNKSCAINEDWQALRFVVRLKDRPGR